jgi:hypothetical protein
MWLARRSPRNTHTEHASASGLRAQRDRRVQDASDSFADVEPEAQALLAPGRRTVQPTELLEHQRLILGLDAWSGVADLQLDHADAPAHTDHHLATSGVPQGIADEVLKDSPQQTLIGMDHHARRHHPQLDAALASRRGELLMQGFEQRTQRKARKSRLECVAFETRYVEQPFELFFRTDQSAFHPVRKPSKRIVFCHIAAKSGVEEARSIHRLQKVVAGGCHVTEMVFYEHAAAAFGTPRQREIPTREGEHDEKQPPFSAQARSS